MASKGTYFVGGGFVEKLLRFLNLLEPGRMVLSLSKMSLWATTLASLYVVHYHSTNVEALLGVITAQAGSLGNYAYRRAKQYSGGQPPYPPVVSQDAPDEK